MKSDSRLSGVLHVLVHMAERRAAGSGPITSDALARMMDTNPVVIRRIMAGLRERGYVTSGRGHGGGWTLSCDPAAITLYDIYEGIGAPSLFAIGNRRETPDCLVEQAVNAALDASLEEAERLLLASYRQVSLASLSADVYRRRSRGGENSSRENAHDA